MATTDAQRDASGSVLAPSSRAHPYLFDLPEGWTTSTSWRRAQTERDHGGTLDHPAERYVHLDGSEDAHRVFWALQGATLRCKCGCKGFRYGDGAWCAHVASLWWRWARGRIRVPHVKTGREYDAPPAWLELGETADVDVDVFSPAELDAWLHTVRGSASQREFAAATDRSHGTVGNLVRRARWKLEGGR